MPVVEAMLLALGEPATAAALAEAAGADLDAIEAALGAVQARHDRPDSGLVLVEVGKRWQLRTDPRFRDAVSAARGGRPQRLSTAALEVLSVVAYQQPVTRMDVDAVRGVDSGRVLKALLDRGLVRVTGRADQPGRPLHYGTADGFLELFGLRSLADLPTLADREELGGEAVSAGQTGAVPPRPPLRLVHPGDEVAPVDSPAAEE